VTVRPLAGRDGHIGGIESLVVDGTRYYFGFDYQSDLVLSPLIDDPVAMARFAVEHMEQTDGKHDEAYWAELVDIAAEDSGLAGREDTEIDLGSRQTTYHLRYLLGAACGWDDAILADDEVTEALTRLKLDPEEWDSLDECLKLEGPDAELVKRRYLEHFAVTTPGNWRTVFAPLLA
jgi:hypothetical protein